MKLSKKNKNIAFMIAGLIALVGSYNAVVINSESGLSKSSMGSNKRLDEMYGVKTPGRSLATTWAKLEAPKKIKTDAPKAEVAESKIQEVPAFQEPTEAAVTAELSLNLVEVINPKIWKNGLTNKDFSGSISTQDGVIESLNVGLPNGEGLSVAFSEMTGNVFEYDLNGEIYTGMMYQVDQEAYMVTLNNGPLEGTRLRFSSKTLEVEKQETQDYLADHNIEMGAFGEAPTTSQEYAQEVQTEQNGEAELQGFKFNQQVI